MITCAKGHGYAQLGVILNENIKNLKIIQYIKD